MSLHFYARSASLIQQAVEVLGHSLQHPQQHFPYRRIGTRAYNADNRRSVVGVADVGLQLKMSP